MPPPSPHGCLDHKSTTISDLEGLGHDRFRLGSPLTLLPTRPTPSQASHQDKMASPPPNAFSNQLASWVYHECIGSIVLVNFAPKNTRAIQDAMKVINPIPKNLPNEVLDELLKEREDESQVPRCSTGFFIGDERQLSVMTCAHSLDHICNSTHSISAQRINEMFRVSIHCDHSETRYREGTGERKPTPAVVVQADCKKDLLLLQVRLTSLQSNCDGLHRPLALAQSFPRPLETVVMLSWPPYMPRTACVGETSHHDRVVSEADPNGEKGYTMKLSEISIMADQGSSGAPVLNGEANVAGLHAGAKKSLCYFVSLPDIRAALLKWGVIE